MSLRTTIRSATLVALALLALPTPTRAQTASPDPFRVSDGIVMVGTRIVLTSCPNPVRGHVGENWVLGCLDGRVRVVAISSDGDVTVLDDRRSETPISSAFELAGVPWVIANGVATAVSALPAPPPPLVLPLAPPPAPASSAPALVVSPPDPYGITASSPTAAAPEPSARPPLAGEILSVHGTRAVISIGRSAGLIENARIQVERPASAADDMSARPIVGRVVALADTRSEIEVGFGELLTVGAAVRVTEYAATRVLTDPTPHRSFIALDIGARAWIDAAGIGTLDEIGLTYRADIPFAIRARLMPFAALYVGPTTDRPEEGGGVVAGGAVDAMFDDRYFALGVGIGFGSYVSSRIIRAAPGVPSNDAQRVGFSLLPSLRIGTVDGLHLSVQFSALAVIDEFRFGGFTADAQIPLVPGFWLVPRGGYSISGLGYVDLGLRVAVDGNGGAGSLFVIPSLGWAGMDTGNHGFRSGPTIGVTLETRFGI